jgi:iron complex transport system ATP-binding protein
VLAQLWEPPREGARYLLLDEPTASLDLAHQPGTLALARRWAGAGTGVLAVLHDLNLAAQYADRIAMLQAGRLLACGPPGEVLTPERVSGVFGLPVAVSHCPGLDRPLVVALPPERVPPAGAGTPVCPEEPSR